MSHCFFARSLAVALSLFYLVSHVRSSRALVSLSLSLFHTSHISPLALFSRFSSFRPSSPPLPAAACAPPCLSRAFSRSHLPPLCLRRPWDSTTTTRRSSPPATFSSPPPAMARCAHPPLHAATATAHDAHWRRGGVWKAAAAAQRREGEKERERERNAKRKNGAKKNFHASLSFVSLLSFSLLLPLLLPPPAPFTNSYRSLLLPPRAHDALAGFIHESPRCFLPSSLWGGPPLRPMPVNSPALAAAAMRTGREAHRPQAGEKERERERERKRERAAKASTWETSFSLFLSLTLSLSFTFLRIACTRPGRHAAHLARRRARRLPHRLL